MTWLALRAEIELEMGELASHMPEAALAYEARRHANAVAAYLRKLERERTERFGPMGSPSRLAHNARVLAYRRAKHGPPKKRGRKGSACPS